MIQRLLLRILTPGYLEKYAFLLLHCIGRNVHGAACIYNIFGINKFWSQFTWTVNLCIFVKICVRNDFHISAPVTLILNSGQSYSYCTPLTCCSTLVTTNWFLMPTRTTLRSTGLMPTRRFCLFSAIKCPSVSMKFRLGWHPIGCSWITPRLKFSGAHLLVDNIRSRLVRYSGPHWHH